MLSLFLFLRIQHAVVARTATIADVAVASPDDVVVAADVFASTDDVVTVVDFSVDYTDVVVVIVATVDVVGQVMFFMNEVLRYSLS